MTRFTITVSAGHRIKSGKVCRFGVWDRDEHRVVDFFRTEAAARAAVKRMKAAT
jgi:hypothetical protein